MQGEFDTKPSSSMSRIEAVMTSQKIAEQSWSCWEMPASRVGRRVRSSRSRSSSRCCCRCSCSARTSGIVGQLFREMDPAAGQPVMGKRIRRWRRSLVQHRQMQGCVSSLKNRLFCVNSQQLSSRGIPGRCASEGICRHLNAEGHRPSQARACGIGDIRWSRVTPYIGCPSRRTRAGSSVMPRA